VPYPISWADEERDFSAWLGNDMQNDAFNKLYGLKDLVKKTNDPKILTDWRYLQVSDHFYYMSTKFFSDGEVHKYFNPYESPYDAFINYMNVLSDFTNRINDLVGSTEMETAQLRKIIKEKDEQIEALLNEINELKENEVSWEVCNKVGGIHTVISSKAGLLQKKFNSHYITDRSGCMEG
jgi:alpha-amylase